MTRSLDKIVATAFNRPTTGFPLGIRLRQYETAERLFFKSWTCVPGVTEASLKHGTFDGGMSYADMVDAINGNGFWGFAAQKTRVIHVWVGRNATRAAVIALLGHELGHLADVFKIPKTPKGVDRKWWRDESVADVYAEVAVIASHWASELVL